MSQEKTRKSGRVTIDAIDAPSPVQAENNWVTVAKAFNPLGFVAEAYARTLAYRLEAKRLDAEIQRVNTQADVIHNALDKTYRLKMEELSQRRLEIERFYDTVQGELKLLHIERMKVLEMAERASEMAFSNNTPSEHKIIFKDMATELISQLSAFGSKANESLDVLVKILPPISMPDHLLPSGD
jgi:hypothetical protein